MTRSKAELGILGEDLVAQWLQQQGWQVLKRRWHSRWGEIDVVAQHPAPCLAFVEVKTRSYGNWDENGLLAINFQKRAKLWRTAQLFLVKHPHLAEWPCRFDVALVSYQKINHPENRPSTSPKVTQQMQGQDPSQSGFHPSDASVGLLAQTSDAGERLILRTYLEAAFE